MGEWRNECNILIEYLKGRLHRRSSSRREDAIEANLMTGFSWLKVGFSVAVPWNLLFEGLCCVESAKRNRFAFSRNFS
jgi:hypothetical protein